MYDKIVLTEEEARDLYKEDLILREDNRIVFRKTRYFREFLGVAAYTSDYKAVIKGATFKVSLELPAYIPLRDPAENWFQVAMRRPIADFRDPLGLEARYKGFLPCYFTYDPDTKDGVIMVEDDPSLHFADCILFIYDRVDYGDFIAEVENNLNRFLERGAKERGPKVARDRNGNTIMASDSLTDQAMMLMPIALLPGQWSYVTEMWQKILLR